MISKFSLVFKNSVLLFAGGWAFQVGFGLCHGQSASADWTDIAAADRDLMGDYTGIWYDPPDKSYQKINPTLSAQVINVDVGHYRVRFVQNLDRRAEVYFEGDADLKGQRIAHKGDEWNFTVGKDGLNGTGTIYGKTGPFKLERVVLRSPTLGKKAPEGAIVLFDGSNFDAWEHQDGRAVTWTIPGDGSMEVPPRTTNDNGEPRVGGTIVSKQSFKDVRFHMEFRYPVEPGKKGQGRGNSGLFFQGSTYEVQILNSYGLEGYWNECGALYRLIAPKVNAARPPLQWQTYDVEYRAARFDDTGKVKKNARITVRQNGVLIHNDQELFHRTQHREDARFIEPPRDPGPIMLQDHSNRLQFRNIWVEELD